jgi:hypothetical protein
MKLILSFFALSFLFFSCKKESVEPVLEIEPVQQFKMATPKKILIYDSISNSKYEINVEYNNEGLVSRVYKDIITANSIKDSTVEQIITYENGLHKTIYTRIEYLNGQGDNKTINELFTYKNGRPYKYQIVSDVSGKIETSNYHYFVVKNIKGLSSIKYIKKNDSLTFQTYVSIEKGIYETIVGNWSLFLMDSNYDDKRESRFNSKGLNDVVFYDYNGYMYANVYRESFNYHENIASIPQAISDILNIKTTFIYKENNVVSQYLYEIHKKWPSRLMNTFEDYTRTISAETLKTFQYKVDAQQRPLEVNVLHQNMNTNNIISSIKYTFNY